jgi:uncharacterized damage-inducible protein DinB
MTLNEFIEDAFNVEQEYLMDALGDLTPEEMIWRAGPEANSIGWILWHMTRVEDMWFQFLPARDNGFGHTLEQVAEFPAYDLAEMLKYGTEVRTATLKYLKTVTAEQMDVVPREARPEMSIGRIFRQVVGEMYQHQGHIAYLKGLSRAGK